MLSRILLRFRLTHPPDLFKKVIWVAGVVEDEDLSDLRTILQLLAALPLENYSA